MRQTPATELRFHEEVLALARSGETEHYLAALLAPPAERAALLAIAAFSADLDRITTSARDPLVGEIRLQWWRDALPEIAGGSLTGNPIADQLGAAVRRYDLPSPLFGAMIDGHAATLYPDPLPDRRAFESHLSQLRGPLFASALRVLACPGEHLVRLCEPAGRISGLARLACRLPRLVAAEHLYLPDAYLAEAGIGREQLIVASDAAAPRRIVDCIRREIAELRAAVEPQIAVLSRHQRIALLPLATVPLQTQIAGRQAAAGFREVHEMPALGRITRIWLAHWSLIRI